MVLSGSFSLRNSQNQGVVRKTHFVHVSNILESVIQIKRNTLWRISYIEIKYGACCAAMFPVQLCIFYQSLWRITARYYCCINNSWELALAHKVKCNKKKSHGYKLYHKIRFLYTINHINILTYNNSISMWFGLRCNGNGIGARKTHWKRLMRFTEME